MNSLANERKVIILGEGRACRSSKSLLASSPRSRACWPRPTPSRRGSSTHPARTCSSIRYPKVTRASEAVLSPLTTSLRSSSARFDMSKGPPRGDVEQVDTLVLGAGAAGLSAASALLRLGLPATVLEASDVAASWRGRYDG